MGVGEDVVFIVVVRLGRPLRVTAGEEVRASPGHSRFLFGAGAAHLLPGNHRDIRSAAGVCVCVCVCSIVEGPILFLFSHIFFFIPNSNSGPASHD